MGEGLSRVRVLSSVILGLNKYNVRPIIKARRVRHSPGAHRWRCNLFPAVSAARSIGVPVA